MSNSLENLPTKELVLFSPSSSPIQLQVVDLVLIKQDNNLFECRLTFRVNSELYQKINTESLFNLKKELRGSLNALSFQSEADIEIEATLKPQLLPQLAEEATYSETAITYLIACSEQSSNLPADEFQEKSLVPLLLTESWFALKVKQHQESGEIGYRTFWSYLNPVILTPEALTSGAFSVAMEQFLKERNEANLLIVEKAISETLEELSNDLKNWDKTEFMKQTETVISDFFSEVTNAFENWVAPYHPIGNTKVDSKGQIYQAMIKFFSEDDWAFTRLQGELALRLAFKGKNGQWNCFAQAMDDRKQFIFYSIFPSEVSEDKRLAIAELLARVNYRLTIGNFEFNFDNGEIFYKTSIDVTGDRLTSALIKQLVYTNVSTMDQYLPGIMSIMSGNFSPEEIIRQIEN